jgi:hypothetical protein
MTAGLKSGEIGCLLASRVFQSLTRLFVSDRPGASVILSVTPIAIQSRGFISGSVGLFFNLPVSPPSSAFVGSTFCGLTQVLDFTSLFSVSADAGPSCRNGHLPVTFGTVDLATRPFGGDGSTVSSPHEAQTMQTAILGGVIAGISAFLIAVGVAAFFLWRQRRRSSGDSLSDSVQTSPLEMSGVTRQTLTGTFMNPETLLEDVASRFSDVWREDLRE